METDGRMKGINSQQRSKNNTKKLYKTKIKYFFIYEFMLIPHNKVMVIKWYNWQINIQ